MGALLLLLCLISTLSTINSQVSGSTGINTTITLLAALPLFPLFYLAPMYCKKRVVPKVRQSFAFSTSRNSKIANEINLINVPYKPPTTTTTTTVAAQMNVDGDIGNEIDEDDNS